MHAEGENVLLLQLSALANNRKQTKKGPEKYRGPFPPREKNKGPPESSYYEIVLMT